MFHINCQCFCVIREDLGFRWVSEQVSHHPPVSAFHAEGIKNNFMFHGSIYPKLKFWGKSVEAEPRGIITLELPLWVIYCLTWTAVNMWSMCSFNILYERSRSLLTCKFSYMIDLCIVNLLCFSHNEAYTWTNPICCVHNIIMGQLWIEQYGNVEIINHK